MQEVPYGFCQCGCGGRAPISPVNDARLGYIKGEPRRFIRWHKQPAPWRTEMRDCGYETPCEVWLGVTLSSGYGQAYLRGKTWLAHRLAYARAFGEIPDGMVICHRCDNRPCVNPEHLFLGSTMDNIADMLEKGRAYQQVSLEKALRLVDLIEVQAITGQRAAAMVGGISTDALCAIRGRHGRWAQLLPPKPPTPLCEFCGQHPIMGGAGAKYCSAKCRRDASIARLARGERRRPAPYH